MTRVCVLTGAGSGIGRALAWSLVEEGWHVVLAGRRAGPLEQTAAGSSAPDRCEVVLTDVTVRASVDALVAHTLDLHGHIDLLVNNAGVGIAGELTATRPGDWELALGANTHGVIHGMEAVIPAMRARGRGHIVNIGSVAGLVPRPGMAPYAASKHAVTAITLAARVELAHLGIDVTLVAPGSIDTEILDTTTYRGVDGDRVRSLARGRLMTAGRCATIILAGIERRQAIVVVTAAAKAEWWLFRISPRLGLRIARARLWLMRRLVQP